MLRLHPRFLGVTALCVAQLLAPDARADAPAADKAAAEALFDEARALMKEGKHEAACPKLAQSQRIDPGIGTLLYLASCYEKVGKLATAWVMFREAAGAAHLAGQPDREKAATARATALAPSLPRLTIEPSLERGDPEILRDGAVVAKDLWGTAVPVDPGPHTIEVRLAGHKPRTLAIALEKGEALSLPIPPLERDDAATPVPARASSEAPATASAPTDAAASPAPAGDVASPARRALPYAVAGAGAAAIAAGAVFGLRAFSLASDVEAACPSGPCSPAIRAKADDSTAAGNVSTALFAAGAIGVAVGVVLWVTTPRGAARAVTANASGLAVRF